MTFQHTLSNLDPVAYVILALILAVFIASLIISFVIRLKYKGIMVDLEKPRGGRFKSDLLNKILDDYKSTALGNNSEINTQAIIEKHFSTSNLSLQVAERFIKNSVSLLIVLGLLGTFLGLTLAIGELISMMIGIDSDQIIEMFRTIGTSLLTSLRGMSTAFTTSLFGISFSIILTVFNIILNVEESRETLMVHIEEYLDNTVSLLVSKDKETELVSMNRILRETFTEFGKKIEKSMAATAEIFGDKLKGAVMEVNLSSQVLDNTVERFDSSLRNFADNIKDFTEFNINLRNNIEIMDVSFIKVTEALKDTTKTIQTNYNSLEGFSKEVQIAVSQISTHNRKVIDDMEILVDKVKTTILGVKEIGQAMKDEIGQREKETLKYSENLSSLMVNAGKEISLLGEHTSEAFEKSLSDSSKAITKQLSEDIKSSLSEIYNLLETFRDNEKMLSKTISMLPDQFMTYSEAAAVNVENKMNELIKSVKNN